MSTTAPNCRNSKLNPSWNAAARKHYRAAVRLRAQAERLYSEQEIEGAAELMYMAAKRTVNAVANSRSHNPISTRAKYRQLKRIVHDTPQGKRLLPLWNAAHRLILMPTKRRSAQPWTVIGDWRRSSLPECCQYF